MVRPHTPYVSEPEDHRIWKHLLPLKLLWNLSVGTALLLSAAFLVCAFQPCWVVNDSRASFVHATRLGKLFCGCIIHAVNKHFTFLRTTALWHLICPSYIKKNSQDDIHSFLHPKAVKVTAYSVLLKSEIKTQNHFCFKLHGTMQGQCWGTGGHLELNKRVTTLYSHILTLLYRHKHTRCRRLPKLLLSAALSSR